MPLQPRTSPAPPATAARAVAASVALSLALATFAAADEARGVVVDQTSSPLPGVTVQLLRAGAVVKEVVTSAGGRFALGPCPPASRIRASLSGFDKVDLPCDGAGRIVLALAGMSETVDVVASATAAAESLASQVIGAALSGVTLKRLPVASPHAREALPLLPSVVRGADGLMRIDGVRPHESPLLIDGFNVTDPATGVSSIDLPVESVRGTEVVRDPMAITYGGALGSLASIETRSGGDAFEAGLQGFVPRPRLTGGGFGRLEGFSPRAFASGRAGAPVRFLVSGEYDFDRIPVPGVTTSSGTPDTRQVGGSVFGRVDLQLSGATTVALEGIFFPFTHRLLGLSPLRAVEASPTLRERDAFGGIVGRHVSPRLGMFTVRVGVLSHDATLLPTGDAQPEITPAGWTGDSFSSTHREADRIEGAATWQRRLEGRSGTHDVTLALTAETRRLRGTVEEHPVAVRDAAGTLVRTVGFGPPSTLDAEDASVGLALRDLWRPSPRLQLDAGVRGDWSDLGGSAPSARWGLRYSLGDDATVIKGGAGTFVGSVPLLAAAFGGFPSRFDRRTQAAGPATLVGLQPAVGSLALPRAGAANVRVERRVAAGWDALAGVGVRTSSRLASLSVVPAEGSLLVTSSGRSTYREAEVALRHTWGEGDQVFVSYTRSSARGELSDFSTLFASGDTEILQPEGRGRLAADAPHRLLAWATVTLPFAVSLSPALEWRSGFPYSVVDAARTLVGPPSSASFPAFVSLDLVVKKSLTIKGKRLKLEVQIFNATDHFNPRDVYAVAGAPRFGSFVNSVGPTVRGDIGIDW